VEQLNDRISSLPPDEENERVATLNAEISEFESKLSAAAVFEQKKQERAKALNDHKKLTRLSTLLEELVEYFGKDGIKAKLLGGSVGSFINQMNVVLAEWGYHCDLQLEPYGFQVSRLLPGSKTDGAKLSLELLSNSERLRFGVAFQVALAITTGIRMVVVDEVDMLDTAGRSAFYEMLLASDLDQAIAIGTDEREEVPEIPGTVFYRVTDGSVAKLGVPLEVAA
jgi:DNA repair exonuclease SbcCD ATPase subunit